MDKLFVPNLHSFAMDNVFTGSCGAFRFRAKPCVVNLEASKEVDFANSFIHCEFWHGPFCYEKSEMEGAQDFPMSESGVQAMKAWLESNI